MSLAYFPYGLPLFVAGGVALHMALVAWRRRTVPGATSFTVLMIVLIVWAVPDGLFLMSDAPLWQHLWTKVEYVGIAAVPVAWLLTAMQYTGRSRWLRPGVVAALLAVPVVTILLVWTFESHSLIYQQYRFYREGGLLRLELVYGGWFWANLAYAYTLLLWGAGVFLLAASRSFHIYRAQAVALLVGVALPWVGNALHIFRLSPIEGLDPTPFMFALTGLPLGWAILRFRLFDLAPVARMTLLEGMRDAVIVLDHGERVVDFNPAARRIMPGPMREVVGLEGRQILGGALDQAVGPDDDGPGEATLTVRGEERFFEVDLFPLAGTGNRAAGHLVVLHDITERKALGHELDTAREEIEILSGLLPICAWCKQIRDDEGYWSEIETYISQRSEAQFTHSICPKCSERMGMRRNRGDEDPQSEAEGDGDTRVEESCGEGSGVEEEL